MRVIRDKYRTPQDRSKRSERILARLVGGRVQPASGALRVAGLKGDVVTKKYMFDDKVTWRESFSISRKAWKKLQRDAFKMGNKQPILRVVFEDGPTLYIMGEQAFMKTWV
jgi:hypothetical protein